jgi:uncharacterized iron-regulated protein
VNSKASLGPKTWCALLCLTLGCTHANTPVGYELDPPQDPPAHAKPKPLVRPKVAADAVQRAAGAVQVVRLRDGAELSGPALGRELLEYDAVCAGEAHDSAAQHYGQLWLEQRLAARADNLGLELGVGFEMWANRFQGTLNYYASGKLSEADFLEQTEYESRWGYSFSYYRPLLETARNLGLPLVALNARSEVTSHIPREGLADLPQSLGYDLPELDLSDPEHRADFERRMKDHPGIEPGDLDRYYAAQVVWDETMAENAGRWLDRHTPVRRLLIIAGQAHCQRSAIPSRIERRAARRVAALLLATAPLTSDEKAPFDYALIVGPGPAS